MEALDQSPSHRRLGISRIFREVLPLEEKAGVAGGHRVGNRHHLAVDLARRLRDPDVVAQRLAHLDDPIEALEEREDGNILGSLVVGAHDVAAVEKIEELVSPADLEIGIDSYRVIGLAEGVEDLVSSNRRFVLEPFCKVFALEDGLERLLSQQSKHVGGAHLRKPLGVVADLGVLGIEDLEGLIEVGLGVGLHLLLRQDRPRLRAAAGVADPPRVVADDQNGGVLFVLEHPEDVEHDQVADVDVGSGGIHAELHPERFPRLQATA